jgi:hypothetical protein
MHEVCGVRAAAGCSMCVLGDVGVDWLRLESRRVRVYVCLTTPSLFGLHSAGAQVERVGVE